MTGNRRHFGNVRRFASGRYQAAYWHDGRRHVAPYTFDSKADANVFLDSVSASIRRGDWIAPELGRISFADYAVLWLAQRTDIRPRTREQYGLLIGNKLIPAFGHRELAKITPLHVRSWYADIAGKTPGSARSAYRLLKAIFNTAILDDLIVKNPCRVKGGGTDRVVDRRIPNVDQVAALTLSMPEQYRAAVTLAAWGTLRRGEVLGLNRQDVDLRAGTVRVERSLHEFYDGRLELGPTKNGDPRKVYMPSSVMPALEEHLRRFVGPESDAPLFLGAHWPAAPSEQLRGHLGDRTPAGRPQVGPIPRPPPLRRHDVRLHGRQHQGDHEPRRVEVGRHGGALRARIRRARRAFGASAERVRRSLQCGPNHDHETRRSRT
jgi:integrase